MFIDSYYTPKILADKLVSYITKTKIKTVVDFCVGDGDLLKSANNKWPKANFYGSDISSDAINITRQQHGNWNLHIVDFLDNDLIARNKLFGRSSFDLILLNPPFSCKGGGGYKVEYKGDRYIVSTAMKFLLEAIKHLKPSGQLYAILPASVAYSQRDSKIWNLLEAEMNLSILEESKRKYFKDCTPNIILVSLNDFTKSSKYKLPIRIAIDTNDLVISRGNVSMHLVRQSIKGFFLVHTTNINNNKLQNLSIKVNTQYSRISGPAILIPRVGNPKVSKICVINSMETYVLSDCIIAIGTKTKKEALLLYKYLIDNWEMVEELYTGTGARYITIDKISKFLNLDVTTLQFINKAAI